MANNRTYNFIINPKELIGSKTRQIPILLKPRKIPKQNLSRKITKREPLEPRSSVKVVVRNADVQAND